MRKGLTRLAAAAALLSAAAVAQATPITYTFSGIGSGDVDGSRFSGAFTFTFTADTANVDTSDAINGYYRLYNVGGTFTEGNVTETLTPHATIVATSLSSIPRVNVFDAAFDNGVGLNNPLLTGYNLLSSTGPIAANSTSTDPNVYLTFTPPTGQNPGFATTDGGTVIIATNTALTFTAALNPIAAVPEPTSITLLAAGLIGLLGMALRARMRSGL